MSDRDRIIRALYIATHRAGFDGSHHKQYALDRIVRALCGCKGTVPDDLVANDEYRTWVAQFQEGDDGPETYEWDEGTPP